VKRKYTGLTMIELITVVSIIALLMALLIPSVAAVHRYAKVVQQTAQIETIETALDRFKLKYGDYPPSEATGTNQNYGGAQKLADALVGRDLMGYFPGTKWDTDNPDLILNAYNRWDNDGNNVRDEIPFKQGTSHVFSIEDLGLRDPPVTITLPESTNVICDVFGRWPVTRPDGTVVKAGVPILYYRANATGNVIEDIYKQSDNSDLAWAVCEKLDEVGDIQNNPMATAINGVLFYGTNDPRDGIYGYIQDPMVEIKEWPYNPDSYLLISAGPDGIYGNADDITNFR
jgi:type II secretory pathway pseudopilin PulG